MIQNKYRVMMVVFAGLVAVSKGLNCPSTASEVSSVGSLSSIPPQGGSTIWLGTSGVMERNAIAVFSTRWSTAKCANQAVACGTGTVSVDKAVSSTQSSSSCVNWGLKSAVWGVTGEASVGSSCSSVLVNSMTIHSSIQRSQTYKYEVNWYLQLCDIHVDWSLYKYSYFDSGTRYFVSSNDDDTTVQTTIYKEEMITMCCNTN
ncbi:MAG: hypothetical protein JXR40_02310 [Pontiellaceae bacterium]|nr:hypothetical protein [Pontiellaceae bacterium]